ncbi:nitrogen fixation/metabolism regulation signal transduction histidine kinase [Clostridium acetobutylicum]|uniref:Predicted membrane protein n=1 Tax=Clostridium acetobutylicum (strain ATCC 824 / DSM 792 / JCM 1419 / IAM 19013 / LMG 5710 / NBRC 13948 / NRRL B-527 / VKM B-1787 / 2291 / W) TaxID=272562 RepID=Q97LE6_CLOAB|nr:MULTISPECIES: hypothetical protein [Clostridium]AAK78593.1 Predicted membrane protein [Clostridium acetobutylicum ATCC 824]ADZ19667.1 membrane protein [Clostridium acetobutylicum EA 2018]AEI31338.1 hypothetical protein SMB_G0630 [Clostridium acetobutylicum DSM 1731]AWV80318.1 hypothetical protein DK921_09455 [Clostridium acetobutylicum]MBC2392503.1 hypothetical protein [Clostridium acetobutylicum]
MKEALKKYNLPIVFVITYVFGCVFAMLCQNTAGEVIMNLLIFALIVLVIYAIIFNYVMYSKMSFGQNFLYILFSSIIYIFGLIFVMILSAVIGDSINNSNDDFGFLLMMFGTSFTMGIFFAYLIPIVPSAIVKLLCGHEKK